MVINAIVDRIENGYAVLLSNDCGLEISIPVEAGESEYVEGESVSLIIDDDGLVKNIG
ncbi:MAG: hypothetical protein ACOYWZ_06665 [Bacillota bacterium]